MIDIGNFTVPESEWDSMTINPKIQYPDEYKEFNSGHGFWDYNGIHAGAFEGDTILTYREVTMIINKRKDKDAAEKQMEMDKLQVKWDQEIKQWKLRENIANGDIDTTDINSMFNAYTSMGGLGMNQVQQNIEELMEIIGDIDLDEMKVMEAMNPGMVYQIVWKVYRWLKKYTNHPTGDFDYAGKEITINLYEKGLEEFIEKMKNKDGEVPEWCKVLQTIFKYGKMLFETFDQHHEAAQGMLSSMFE